MARARRSKTVLYLVLAAAAIAAFLFLPRHEPPPPASSPEVATKPASKPNKRRETGRKKRTHHRQTPPLPTPVAESKHTLMVAIIIDDLGNNLREVDEAIGLGVPLCVAVMPHQRYSTETARRARAAGLCVLLHMPMQPKDNAAGLGVGALMSGMDAGSVRRTLFSDLSSVPGCIGVNNHMGSLVTAEAGIMQPLMTALKTRNMFFVDSMTAPDSRAGGSANAIGVAHCNRDVFLDNTLTDIEIEAQVERLIRIARRKGSAVAICHPHPETFAVLKKLLPKLKSEGITIVNITEMVK